MKINPAEIDYTLSHELFISAIVPRPIAFISSVNKDGVFNLAPFSYYAAIASKPALVGISISTKRDGEKKDTLANIEFTKDFVLNVVTEDLAQAMNQTATAYASDIDEFKEVGLTAVKADLVKPPMVAESPVNMECRVIKILEFGQFPRKTSLIIGEVVRVHVKDEFWVKNEVQTAKLKAIGRLGGDSYCRINDIFQLKFPDAE
jgi:flavin reductase (DIM6/NTAB) family NADH-FMN oxidoreductase RutF